jgi:hypothetical protein
VVRHHPAKIVSVAKVIDVRSGAASAGRPTQEMRLAKQGAAPRQAGQPSISLPPNRRFWTPFRIEIFRHFS